MEKFFAYLFAALTIVCFAFEKMEVAAYSMSFAIFWAILSTKKD